jgi:hypothetical protein
LFCVDVDVIGFLDIATVVSKFDNFNLF